MFPTRPHSPRRMPCAHAGRRLWYHTKPTAETMCKAPRRSPAAIIGRGRRAGWSVQRAERPVVLGPAWVLRTGGGCRFHNPGCGRNSHTAVIRMAIRALGTIPFTRSAHPRGNCPSRILDDHGSEPGRLGKPADSARAAGTPTGIPPAWRCADALRSQDAFLAAVLRSGGGVAAPPEPRVAPEEGAPAEAASAS
jgi:hypothetical protein